MLHEILLSLSGHPSPLLQNAAREGNETMMLSPQERALLKSIAHLGETHCHVISATKNISTSHKSSICQAVATSIKHTQLVKFQRRILDCEQSILRKDSELVGDYNVVPLTMIVDMFSGWTRRMEWFLEVCHFVRRGCTGAGLIDRLCAAVQTGYSDIEEVSLQLVQVAETAWLKQVTGWLLYGRLPSFGGEDFFIQQDAFDDGLEYELRKDLLPAFATFGTASSILFIGKSLNQIRNKGVVSSRSSSALIPNHLKLLSNLKFPITQSSLNSVVVAVRASLSRNALQELLPASRIDEVLTVLHEFFLLGRGEFAIALITEADEKARGRHRRIDHSNYEKRERFTDIVIKEGEVKAVLSRTWTAMASMQSTNEDEEEQFELAKDLIDLNFSKTSSTPMKPTPGTAQRSRLASTPFNNLLLSVPTTLAIQIPSPLDLFLSPTDVQVYSHLNAYLLAIRRAYLRLADLWKMTSLRRSHPAPPAPPYGSTSAGGSFLKKKRERENARSKTLRGIWAASSAALFLLGETEAYFHGEVVHGIWTGFQEWRTGQPKASSRPSTAASKLEEEEDIWAAAGEDEAENISNVRDSSHDPEALAQAHRSCLAALTTSLLLTQTHTPFTDSLYSLLLQTDALVNLVHRIRSIWENLDLEADDGVIDAFLDFHKEEEDVEEQLNETSEQVKKAIEEVVHALRAMDHDKEGREPDVAAFGGSGWKEGNYIPRRVGRVDRLLMKLDFGGWFDGKLDEDEVTGNESDDNDNFRF